MQVYVAEKHLQKGNVCYTHLKYWRVQKRNKLLSRFCTAIDKRNPQLTEKCLRAGEKCRHVEWSCLSRVLREVSCGADENQQMFCGGCLQSDIVCIENDQTF